MGSQSSTTGTGQTPIDNHKTDMTEEMQSDAKQVALLALNMYTEGDEIASYIVKEFERKHGGTWVCFVGSFGYHVQKKMKNYIDFSVGGKRIALFRT